ncbi:K02A2.6-like, partial [Cordylochernes scorpioides]
MAQIQPPETFDFSTPNEWPKWRKKFERYLVVRGMKKKEEADKIDLFVYLMGDRADDIFRTFKFEKEKEAKKIDSVLKAFDSHFCVRKNIIYERAKFNSRIQEDREPVDEFITSLYKLADSCEFEGLHEQLIRDRIVVGVRDKALSERMQMDSELTLEKAVKMVRQQEAVRQQQVDLQRPSTSQKVNQVKFNSKKQSPKQQQSSRKKKSAKTRSRCPKCGGFTHREGQACRAEGQRYNLCSKTGHFANCCPEKQAKTAEVKAVSELDEEIGFLLEVAALEDSSNLDDDEGECRRRWTAEIQVNGKQVKFKLDSQADVTCVHLCLLKKIMGQQRIVESDINIRAAEFSELQTVGMFISTLRNGNYEIKEKIYVIRRLSEPLLSRRACELLYLARRIEVVATRINLIKEFPEVFEGLGQIGNLYEIKLKPGAKSYAVHTPRRVPKLLIEKLKTRLEELEKAGIIAQVNVAFIKGDVACAGSCRGMDGVMCYLDDILIFASDSKTHDRILRLVLRKLKEAKVTLNKAKCVFGVPRIDFLGHILNEDGIRPDPAKIEAVTKMPAPTDVHGVRRFLGMVNHLGRFVENLSEIVAPLNQLLVKGQNFVWDCSQERAFRKLKELLTTEPILAAYDVRKPTMVSSDASSYSLGAVLKQEGKNGIWRPVAYSSRTMTPTEKRYAQIDKEALAITWACEPFQDFLLGKCFRIETDHKPLIPLFSTKELSSLTPRLQRFRMRMVRFGFEIVHIPGKELLDADALSRQPLLTTEGGENERPTSAHINAVLSCITDKDEMLTKIFEAQQKNTNLKAVVNYLEQGWPDKKKMSQALLSYWHIKDELGVQNGLLMRSCRLVIPVSMKLEILDKLHAGHFGITKTRLRARETVWWPGISEEIAETVRKCSVCIQEAVSKHEPLIPTNFLPTRPWQKIGMDLFKFENKWYLVVIDYYSRFPEMIQLDRLTANVVVRSCKSIFARHGVPETVVSDNGTQFGAAREFANFARQYGFTHVTSSPRFPQSNGMAETGVKIAKLILNKNQDPSLGLLEYRSTPLENGYSPAELLMGRKLRTTLPIAPDNLNPRIPITCLQQPRNPSNFPGKTSECPHQWLNTIGQPGKPKFERLMNVTSISTESNGDIEELLRRIVKEEISNVISGLDSPIIPKQLEEEVYQRADKTLAPIIKYIKSYNADQKAWYDAEKENWNYDTRERRKSGQIRHESSVMGRRLRQEFPKRKTDEWRTVDNSPICFHCGRPGHVVRYYRERRAVFDSYRDRGRKQATPINHEVDLNQNSPRRSSPSPNRGRSPTRRHRSSTLYRRLSQSPKESNPTDPRRLTALSDYAISARSMARIAVSAPKDMGNADIIITGNKNFVLSKDIFIPAAIVNVHHNQGKVWLANGKSEAQIILRNTCIGFAEPLEEAYLSVVEATSSKTTSTSTEERGINSGPSSWTFNETCPTELHTDASGYGIGAVLVQIQNGEEKAIAYASRALTKAERNYSTTERESLAVVWAITKFRPYLFGKPFTVENDHHALCWLASLKDPSGRLPRWALRLQEYDITVIYKSGHKHKDADSLSRNPLEGYAPLQEVDMGAITRLDLPSEQLCDPDLARIMTSQRNSTEEVLEHLHDAPTAGGHLGFLRTYDRIRRRFYWPGLYRSVKRYVGHCRECQRRKSIPQQPPGRLISIPPAEAPFQRIGIDLLGRFPKSNMGNKWVAVCTDYFTRFAITRALPNAGAIEIAKFLLEEVILKQGAPRIIISDRGRVLQSRVVSEIIKLCDTTHRMTTAYHPQTNGLTERFNKTLGDMLSIYVDVEQKSCDGVLPFVTFVYNTARKETTGFSPFFLLHGREAETTLDTMFPFCPENTEDDYVDHLITKAEESRQLSRLRKLEAQQKDEERYNSRHRMIYYQPGDLVWIFIPVQR